MERVAVLSRHILCGGTSVDSDECPLALSPTLGPPGFSPQLAPPASITDAAQDRRIYRFPQAASAHRFPRAVSDYFQLDSLLKPEEKAVRLRVREFMEKEVAPVIAKYWERAEFPFELVPKLAQLRLAGLTIKGNSCPGLAAMAAGVVIMEMARVDASLATFMLVHTCLGMSTIALLGCEDQKQRYLPSLARLETVACWALTEPDFGSDASSLASTATKVEGGWRLNGQKRWIGNSTFADVIVVWARNSITGEINGFIVRKGAPGYHAEKMENKTGLRCVQNGDITLRDVFVPESDRLARCNSFKDVNKVLAESRLMVSWLPVGIAMGVYDMCARYLQERKQFGAPLAAVQLNQEKLVRILGNVQAMMLMAWRTTLMHQEGVMTHGHASLCKAFNTLRARESVALGRELLGGNGILTDYHVAKAFNDLEPIYTYEGTYDINALVVGREVTGISAIRPMGPSDFQSRLKAPEVRSLAEA